MREDSRDWPAHVNAIAEANRRAKAARIAAELEWIAECEARGVVSGVGKSAEEYGEKPRCYRRPMTEDEELRAMYPREA